MISSQSSEYTTRAGSISALKIKRNLLLTGASCLIAFSMLSDLAQIRNGLGSYDIRLWQGFIILAAGCIGLTGRIAAPKALMALMAILLVHSALISIISGTISWTSIVQIVLIFAFSTTLYSFVAFSGVSVVLDIYLLVARIVSYSILIEALVFLVSPSLAGATIYKILKHFPGPWIFARAHGLMMEPSQVSLVLPPAMFVCLWTKDMKKLLLFSVATLLTFSTLTYMGAAIAICISWVVKKGVPVFRLVLLAMIAVLTVAFVPPIRDRVVAIALVPSYVGTTSDVDVRDEFSALGGSVGSMALALRVSFIGFTSNYSFGVGLGALEIAGDELMQQGIKKQSSQFNTRTSFFSKLDTGGSIVIRLVGELGVLGGIMIFVMVAHVLRALARCRRLYLKTTRTLRNPHVQAVGMFSVVFFTYVIRKDAYVNVYLLLPLVTYLVASKEIRTSAFAADLAEKEAAVESSASVAAG